MSSSLIGEISVSPPSPRPAESFRVEVLDANGNSYENQAGATVYIDDVRGAVQHLQAGREGTRPVLVRVVAGEQTDSLVADVVVYGQPVTFRNNKGKHEPALLSVEQVMSSPYEVSFRLGRPPSQVGKLRLKDARRMRVADALEDLLGREKGSRPTLARAIIGSDFVRSVTTRTVNTNREHLTSRRAEVTTGIVDLGAADLGDLLGGSGEEQAIFEWDFGDGTTKTTASPYVHHDYSDALTPDDEILTFDVRCRAVRDGVEVIRTLSLHSAYALCKQRETIVPPVKADIYAHKAMASFHGVLEVTNLEPVPLTITAQAIVPLSVNPKARENPVFRSFPKPLVLPPSATTVIGTYPSYRSARATDPSGSLEALDLLSTREVGATSRSRRAPDAGPTVVSRGEVLLQALQHKGDVPRDAPGFTVYFAGQSEDGTPVRFSHVFEIHMEERNREPEWPGIEPPELQRRPWPWEEVMRTVDEILTHRKGLADRLAVTVERDMGVIAVSANREALKGKNTALKAAARELARVGLVPMQALTPQFRIAASRGAAAPQEGRAQMEAKSGERAAGTARGSDRAGERLGSNMLPDRPAAFRPAVIRRVSADYGTTVLFTRDGPPTPGPVAEGEVCDPDNISALDQALAYSQQLVCQLSSEQLEVLMPGRFMNGRKGDVVLSPGGPGLIGSLLRAVHPPQQYSHSGIMTRNYDEVTHSTASEERIYDYLVGTLGAGTDGIRPDILKWMWPGVVSQRVEAAVYGENWTDPESGKKYSISSFSPHAVGVTHNGHFKIVPPLIVKPDPMLESSQIRQTLHTVSASARADGAMIDDAGTLIRPIKSHYRLFCYTNPTIGLTDVAPPTSVWANGTYPSVCSSFIWMALMKNNVRFEGNSAIVHPTDLEPADVEGGAGVLPTTLDGLYWYTAQERLAAGTWLYNEMHYKAYDQAGWFGDLLTDAADDLGNQLVNAFALDDPWGKDHDDWKEMTDASAVSPDNILFWDGPDRGGLYGFAEPLIYREPRKELYTVSRWKKVLSRGTLTGTVRVAGQAVQGAHVALYDGMSDLSNGSGVYTLLDVPFGSYELTASRVIDGAYYSATVMVQISQATQTVDIDLQPPADHYRLAQLYIDFYGREDEDWPWDDETTNPGPEYYELELGPDRTTNSIRREYSWGGEARVEYDITVSLLVDYSIQVTVNAVLYEGTSETTNDLDGTAKISFEAPKDHTGAGYIRVVNTDESEEDTYGELTLSVKNAQNNN